MSRSPLADSLRRVLHDENIDALNPSNVVEIKAVVGALEAADPDKPRRDDRFALVSAAWVFAKRDDALALAAEWNQVGRRRYMVRPADSGWIVHCLVGTPDDWPEDGPPCPPVASAPLAGCRWNAAPLPAQIPA